MAHSPMKYVKGMPTEGPFAENWMNVQNFQAREDDVMINTYPKSGTTWACEIVDLIFNAGDSKKTDREAIYERVPFLELAMANMPPTTQILDNMKGRRLIKSHLPAELVPKSFWENNCKIIYVARNGKDVAVSYYHFHKTFSLFPDPGPWESFLERYMEGEVAYGSWSDHVKSWWKIRQQSHVLFLFYEDMLQDPKHAIQQVADFLKQDLSHEALNEIQRKTSFQAMKENPLTNYSTFPNSIMDQSVTPFMRKGICGDWKNNFTVAQSERFDEYYRREMSGTDLTFCFSE
ncbi:sulfotransferase 1 family member D1-like [Hyperolius riggenbachi]|uniref:sulfotransferase 1 family member D1-like n=1 Tax=Hyperolius riggenbachi TaxID=752182 RepID=UPI0035A36FEA